MTFIPHIVVGTCIGVALAQTTGIDSSIAIPLNISISLMPDVNVIWRNITKHHDDFTHYPITWLFITIVAFLIELFMGSTLFFVTQSIFISSTIHMLMDTFGLSIGIHWLAPFNKREFSFTKLGRPLSGLNWKEKLKLFQKTRHLYYELGIISLGVLLSAGLIIL